jgi:hypothetical protein
VRALKRGGNFPLGVLAGANGTAQCVEFAECCIEFAAQVGLGAGVPEVLFGQVGAHASKHRVHTLRAVE